MSISLTPGDDTQRTEIRTNTRAGSHVCVCFRPIYFGESPSDQGETGATLCSLSRGTSLHFFIVFGYFSVQTMHRTNRGATQEGVNTRALLLFEFFLPHRPRAHGWTKGYVVASCDPFTLRCPNQRSSQFSIWPTGSIRPYELHKRWPIEAIETTVVAPLSHRS